MITTSLYKMLPRDEKDKVVVFTGFLLGVVLSFLLNFVVHAYTSESLVHCGHDSQPSAVADSELGADTHQHASEETPLQPEMQQLKPSISRPSLRKAPSLIDLLVKKQPNSGDCYGSTPCATVKGPANLDQPPVVCQAKDGVEAFACPENGIGYDLENLSVYREHFLSGAPHKHEHSNGAHPASSSSPNQSILSEEHHHHHIATPFSKLLSIGIQTCLVISLHKFPEGFIVFFTNHNDSDSRSFGFSIFLSLAMHNFIEGFAMTLPLYAAFKTKFYAVLTASILGGGSQPLGALIGYLIFKHTGSAELHINFLLSLTSGILFLIGLQMLQTAIGFSDSHHHHDVHDPNDVEPHTLATTCLKWCCLGAFLILGSGLFA